MFLTATELAELTGYKLPAYQRRWLLARGWPHEVSAGGKPVVAREFASKALGVTMASPQKAVPNLAALKAA